MNDPEFFAQWGIDFHHRCTGVEIQGSPNRSAERFVFEDQAGERFIAEGFDLRKTAKQQKQNEFLTFLAAHDFPVLPWLYTTDGKAGFSVMARFWQIRPFVSMDPLPRDILGDSTVYANLWKDFLLKLENVSHDPAIPVAKEDRFFFSGYLSILRHHITRKMPHLLDDFEQIVRSMHDFFQAEPDLPVMLAHGDFHPGNCLVKDGRISAVIDWEFYGWKCAGYDLALLTGCLGMDNPSWLVSGCFAEMRQALLKSGYIPASARQFFPELTAAIRLGWLGEWADIEDRKMASREMRFIQLLLENREYLLA